MVLPIYAASEAPIDDVDSEKLVAGIKAHGHKDVCFAPDFTQALSIITHKAKPGDMVLTLGAGDVYTLGEKLVEIL
jgi:UDP-N-acetylmuramate--alanine ligase